MYVTSISTDQKSYAPGSLVTINTSMQPDIWGTGAWEIQAYIKPYGQIDGWTVWGGDTGEGTKGMDWFCVTSMLLLQGCAPQTKLKRAAPQVGGNYDIVVVDKSNLAAAGNRFEDVIAKHPACKSTINVVEPLAAGSGSLTVTSIPKGAKVYVNDNYQGPTSDLGLVIPLKADIYAIRVAPGPDNPNYASVTKNIEVKAGQVTKALFTLEPIVITPVQQQPSGGFEIPGLDAVTDFAKNNALWIALGVAGIGALYVLSKPSGRSYAKRGVHMVKEGVRGAVEVAKTE